MVGRGGAGEGAERVTRAGPATPVEGGDGTPRPGPTTPAAAARTVSSGWRRADPDDLVGRLEAARDLLRRAAALEAAAQARTVAAMTEQERRRVEEVRRGRVRRRRYR